MSYRPPFAAIPHATADVFDANAPVPAMVGTPTKTTPIPAAQANGHYHDEEPSPTEENMRQWSGYRRQLYLDAIDVLNIQSTGRGWNDTSGDDFTALTDPPEVRFPHAIAWRGPAQSMWIAGACTGGTKYLATTVDLGRTWQQGQLPAGVTSDPISVAFAEEADATDHGYLVTGGSPQGAFWGGVNWTQEVPPNATALAGVIYTPGAAGSFLAFGATAAGPGAWRSTGNAAVQCTTGAAAGYVFADVADNRLAGVNRRLLAVADNGAACVGWTSPTGAVWTNTGVSFGGTGVRVGWDEGRQLFVRVGGNGLSCLTSPDGITWTAAGAGLPGLVPWPRQHIPQRVLCRGGLWMVFTRTNTGGRDSAHIWVSTDGGLSWDGEAIQIPGENTLGFAAGFVGAGQRIAVAGSRHLALGLRAR